MTLSGYERETTITYNDAEDTATVYTCNRALMRKLDRLRGRNTFITMICEDDTSKVYHLPKQYISFRLPPLISKETRAKRAEKAKQLSRKRQNNA